jgi:hypothetical protein
MYIASGSEVLYGGRYYMEVTHGLAKETDEARGRKEESG